MNILRIVFVVFSIFNLTGCLTIGLSNNIKDSKYYTEKNLSDTITDVYISKDSSHSIQLSGVNSSFLAFNEPGELKKLLSSSSMDVNYLSLKQKGEFSLYDDDNYTKVYGKVVFVYSFQNLDGSEGSGLFSNVKCQLNEMNQCVFEISDLYGDYNQKTIKIEEQKIIHLQKPVMLNMKKYTEHTPPGSFALMLLYPVTIILDAVTMPVQIFFIPFGMGTVGKQ
ncbi:hypothetical protein QQF54_03435 [Lelliottia sp. V106_10]|uniref:hypothetical protein n=1 Tax=Lelliottia wanjuensis TaxID=3050585 RepID=UPI002551A1AD|nr:MULTISPECIES: hypothetical protein [unclassified Lelliottia]MDK9356921.1 hypothetical protein [Lelliottia sp. V106_16]MDK9372407.1 hypothetical protein [Lelliottia sp. V106_10]MDK9599211.1 hypothetical protein [Lelliottia sp. V106_5]